MKNTVLKGLATAAIMAFSAASADADVIRSYRVGQWQVEANATNGSFRNCSASSSYGGGARVMFMLTRQLTWGLGISNPTWTWRPGSTGNVTYWVDNHSARTHRAQAMSRTSLVISLTDSTALFQQVRAGHRMYFRPHGNNKQFSMTLNGTSAALSALLECVRRFR